MRVNTSVSTARATYRVHAIVCHSQVLAKYARPFVSDLLFWNRRHSTPAANRIKRFWFVLPRVPPICPHSLSYARRFPRPNGKHENFGARDQAAVTASDAADVSEWWRVCTHVKFYLKYVCRKPLGSSLLSVLLYPVFLCDIRNSRITRLSPASLNVKLLIEVETGCKSLNYRVTWIVYVGRYLKK